MGLGNPTGVEGSIQYYQADPSVTTSSPPQAPTSQVNFITDLTLANGMTAGIGPDQVSNRPLGGFTSGVDPYGGNIWSKSLKRVGCMRSLASAYHSAPGVNPTGDRAYFMYFLYNPNQINVALTVNASGLPSLPAINNKYNVPPVPNNPTGQVISWTLFFDRSYDAVYGVDQVALQNRGVLGDVAALYNLMGVFVANGDTPVMFPVQVMFGQSATGAIWGFTGFITDASITYGLFTSNMIPFRCTIDLSMMAMYVPETIPGGPPSSSDSSASSTLDINPVTGLPWAAVQK